MKQKMTGSSGISWTICKLFALHCSQLTTPALITQIFFTGWMLFLLAKQQ